MSDRYFSAAAWRKSSHSGGTSSNCVEVASACSAVGIRDSKNPTSPNLEVSRASFGRLVDGLKKQ
jgi:hypothetical protein